MTVSLIIVTHTKKAAEGIKEFVVQMAGEEVPVMAVGGTTDGRIGTDPERIKDAIDEVYSAEGVLVLVDIGSAVMAAKSVVNDLDPERKDKVKIANAPLIEGAIEAGVQASTGQNLPEIKKAAEKSKNIDKT